VLGRRLAILAGALVALLAIGAAVTSSLGGGRESLSSVAPDHLAVIDPGTNEITAAAAVGSDPAPVAVGDGSVWVGNTADHDLTHLDLRSGAPLGTISLGGRTPTGLAVGGGAVWVANGSLGSLSHVDPGYATASRTLRVAGPSASGGVALGDGSVWAAFGDSTLARVDPDSEQLLGKVLTRSIPSGIVYAAGGVWLANSNDGTVSRFDPATFTRGAEARVQVGKQPVAIAFGEGALWTANGGDSTVTRIDPASHATATVRLPGRPAAIAAGEGAVWVAGPRGAVWRIDPATRRVVKTIRLGNAVSGAGIAVGGGSVWVSVTTRGRAA
jgi:streptogramin lyase